MSQANPDYYFRNVPSFKTVNNGNVFEENRGLDPNKGVMRKYVNNAHSTWNKENSQLRESYKKYPRSSKGQENKRNQDSIQSRFEYTHYI